MDRAVARPRRRRRRIALAVAAAAVLVGGSLAAAPLVRRWVQAERAVDSAGLRVAPVVVGDMDRDVAAQGRVVAALHPTLFSPAQGIVALAVKAGAPVRRGDVLATIASPELASRLAQERATLSSLESELGRNEIASRQARVKSKQDLDVLAVRHEAATRALRRTRDLGEQGVVPVSEVEKAQDDLAIAALELKNRRETSTLERDTQSFEGRTRRLAVERQRSVVGELERQNADLEVKAPFDGIVATVAVQDRDAVAANHALLTVVNLTALEIELELAENQAADVAPGTAALVAYAGRELPAKVVAISPEVRDSQVRGTVAFTGQAPAGLRQSERVSVRLLLDRRVHVLKLPRGPYLEVGGGRSVYVVADGMAVRRPVRIGVTSVSEVEIVGGLRAGERVVVSDTGGFEGAERVLLQ
ncbi:MAG TPA: HlyD family efflux transporter periplasmic adaptor subunit [Kofleriaceae bacterium]|nr:HlyD family efflux transporter periplasmic adaptor subunit [Kofleriaceae bacterium]